MLFFETKPTCHAKWNSITLKHKDMLAHNLRITINRFRLKQIIGTRIALYEVCFAFTNLNGID
jgi:hypothetical protein